MTRRKTNLVNVKNLQTKERRGYPQAICHAQAHIDYSILKKEVDSKSLILKQDPDYPLCKGGIGLRL